MKRLFGSIMFLGLLILMLPSCSKDSGGYSYTVTTFATIIKNPGIEDVTPPSFYLVTDDSLLLKPIGTMNIPSTFPVGDNIRVKALCYVESNRDTQFISPFSVNVTSMETIPTGMIVSTNMPDSLPQGLIQPLNIWYSGGIFNTKRFITINFSYSYIQNPSIEMFILAETGKDDDGYYHLTMASRNESIGSRVSAIITYPLEPRHTEKGIKGMKISFFTFEEKYKEFTIDY